MKPRGMSHTGINEIMLTCPCAKTLRSALLKIDLHLNSTSARSPMYDRAYPEKHLIASPSKPVRLTKRSSVLLFVQPDEMLLEVDKIEGNLFFDTEKFPRSQNAQQNSQLYTLRKLFFNSVDMHHFEACSMR